ncbi:MAG: single-stranded DNA-binding protein [Candidatus Terrybacteria bacterium RIFCSPHIGHO2_01_FULL_48_17]|uniref:Single-stranded DNA-binding protein n=1 Tax=Candidatus Terrybacteria bacterium RIFCSPHIGHO2_01_FULL_48_17 TaxID=1802362 RepID=A0A1G2PHK9_9BACT|nr:MAG: single-stranded DNA-binding protein [Candidatus Terrybacteria bacterium RIFCSPHIGHO2_01_FULL_48_17]OHA53554.1 MAG: single-stranded DNA-binding protein [Candidatus Terrybacteria bacterium RIFCSPLOWO2_01_FULL_48_14]
MNLNKVFLLGNVAIDVEARMTQGGQPVANFRMATNRIFMDKAGQKQQQAEFHTVVCWGRLAEIAREYLKKGNLVLIEGRLQTRSWEGQDGQKRWRTEIVAERLQLGPKGQGAAYKAQGTEPKTEETKKEEEIPVIEEGAPMTFEDEKPPDDIDPKDIPF